MVYHMIDFYILHMEFFTCLDPMHFFNVFPDCWIHFRKMLFSFQVGDKSPFEGCFESLTPPCDKPLVTQQKKLTLTGRVPHDFFPPRFHGVIFLTVICYACFLWLAIDINSASGAGCRPLQRPLPNETKH